MVRECDFICSKGGGQTVRKWGVNLCLKNPWRCERKAVNCAKRIFQKDKKYKENLLENYGNERKKSGTFSACDDEPALSIELVTLAKHVMNLKIINIKMFDDF